MKNLTIDEKIRIENIISELDKDQLLQPTKHKFINILSYTIGGDYRSDKDSAAQEYYVALFKAVTAAIFGWGKHGPAEETLVDPIQRKKFFQTWVFNYLRQILQENKRNMKQNIEYSNVKTYKIAADEFNKILDGRITTSNNDIIIISKDLFSLSRDVLLELHSKIVEYTKQCRVDIYDDKIVVFKINEDEVEIETKTETKIDIISTSARDKESNSDYEIEDVRSFNRHDALSEFKSTLDDVSKQIIQIIMDPPDDYIAQFKTSKPHQKYIAQYLGMKIKDIKDIYAKIRMRYVECIGNPFKD